MLSLMLALAALAASAAGVPVNLTSMSNVGTINVEGVGPVHIVTGSPGNVQVLY
jgi:hypothetical protein